jgi:uncharacterized iron-regulated membrane protein
MKIQKFIYFPVSMLILSSSIREVFAQEEPRRLGELFGIFESLGRYIMPLAGLVCVVFIIIGGYMWMVAAGDPGKIKQAQGTLTWAVIGLILILLSVAIVEALRKGIGV